MGKPLAGLSPLLQGMKFGSLLVRPVARPAAVPESTNSLHGPCVGLRGRRYTPLLASHHEWGGTKEGARNFDILCADLFPYKKDKKKRLPKGDFNRKQTMTGWTTTELARYNAGAEQSSLWRVDWVTEAVKSVHCTRSGPSRYGNHVCAACYALTNVSTFQRSLRKICRVWPNTHPSMTDMYFQLETARASRDGGAEYHSPGKGEAPETRLDKEQSSSRSSRRGQSVS